VAKAVETERRLERRRRRRASTSGLRHWRQRYFELVGHESVGSFRELADRLSSTVNVRAREISVQRGVPAVPVRLGAVAEELNVAPKPEFTQDMAWAKAAIDYDVATDRFRIRIGIPSITNGTAVAVRARFAFAHELGHRLLFSREAEGWRRVRDVVAGEAGAQLGDRVRDHLSELEEVLCNTFARRVLIPPEEFAEFAGSGRWGSGSSPSASDIGQLLIATASTFIVPRTTALLALGDYLRSPRVSWPRGFIVLLVYSSGAKAGDGQRVVIEAATGTRLPEAFGTRLPFLWRANADVLGGAFRSFVVRALAQGLSRPRDVVVPLALPADGRSRVVEFRGRWQADGSHASTGYKSGIIWGLVNPSEDVIRALN